MKTRSIGECPCTRLPLTVEPRAGELLSSTDTTYRLRDNRCGSRRFPRQSAETASRAALLWLPSANAKRMATRIQASYREICDNDRNGALLVKDSLRPNARARNDTTHLLDQAP